MSKTFRIAIAMVIISNLIIIGANIYVMGYESGKESCNQKK